VTVCLIRFNHFDPRVVMGAYPVLPAEEGPSSPNVSGPYTIDTAMALVYEQLPSLTNSPAG
jgi:hypothetical protein